jgi:protein-S-isoprenylcysteine O-methyltransferase
MNGDAPDNFDERLAERGARLHSNTTTNTANTTPKLTLSNVKPAYIHQGALPNTLCTVSTLSALLGAGFAFSLATLLLGTREWWHLSFFFASWCFFHWAEFAVTAGWNEEKCSVDCEFGLLKLHFIFACA